MGTVERRNAPNGEVPSPLRSFVSSWKTLPFPDAGVGGFAVGGAESDGVVAGAEGDVAPGEDAVGVGLGDAAGLAVDEEFGGADVGEGADEDLVGLALGEALLAEVEDGDVIAPVGLIEVVGVLEGLAVVGDEAFVVDAVAVAFGAVAGSEVEEVPDEGAPEVGTLVELGPVEDVVFGLPGLGVELAGGVGLADLLFVVVDGGAGAVFADGDAELGVLMRSVTKVRPASLPRLLAPTVGRVGSSALARALSSLRKGTGLGAMRSSLKRPQTMMEGWFWCWRIISTSCWRAFSWRRSEGM